MCYHMHMDSCIFCKIVKSEIPSFKVSEDENFFAFLSIGPHRPGHTLVIPKVHVDDFFEMESGLLDQILKFSKPLTKALKKAFNPKSGKVGLAVAGLEIPHAHLHLIPMDEIGDLDFSKAQKVSNEEFETNLEKIKQALK